MVTNYFHNLCEYITFYDDNNYLVLTGIEKVSKKFQKVSKSFKKVSKKFQKSFKKASKKQLKIIYIIYI